MQICDGGFEGKVSGVIYFTCGLGLEKRLIGFIVYGFILCTIYKPQITQINTNLKLQFMIFAIVWENLKVYQSKVKLEYD